MRSATRSSIMDSRDYDMVRIQTLLFFFEHLMSKGESRTLHDLSCQFGTKGFTKEMRQIAGGSQAGLKKFLLQHPSLFTVNDDTVFITSYMNSAKTSPEASVLGIRRDYAKEAVAYFSDKLKQYGAGTEVPIRSLLGHRSQAPPEVRHVSGQHIREFKDFLSKYEDSFEVTEETVMLKNHDGKVSQLTLPEDIKIDPNVTKEILSVLKQSLESRGPLIVDQLFAALEAVLSRNLWAAFFKGASDLSTFLKMHSDIFHVQSHLVALVKPSEEKIKLNLKPKSSSLMPPASKQVLPTSQQSVKQRVNSVLLKTLSENAGKYRPQISPNAIVCDSDDPSVMKLLHSLRLIANVKECKALLEDLTSRPKRIYGVDSEGVNLGPNGPMTLLMISSMEGEVFAFDVMVCRDLVTEGGLQQFLEDESIIKVMHDCRNDSAAFSSQFGIRLRNVFDTQSAHAVLHHKQTGRPVYKVKSLGLSTLCQLYNAPGNPKKDQMKSIYKKDQRYWARRPLTDDMLAYAAFDVIPLVPFIYEKMTSLLSCDYIPLLEELCEEQIEHFIRRDDVRLKKKSRKAEVEIQELKGKIAAVPTGKTLVLSNREIRLLRYMDLTDEEKEKLEGSQKVLKKLERLQNKGENCNEAASDLCDQFNQGVDSHHNSSNFNGVLGTPYNGPDAEYPSLDSAFTNSTTSPESSLTSSIGGVVSPQDGELPCLTTSMQMVDKLLANGKMDQMEQIEAIWTAATATSCESSNVGKICDVQTQTEAYVSPSMLWSKASTTNSVHVKVERACQTLSTGEIVITKVHFPGKVDLQSLDNGDADSPVLADAL
ncbi:unnamed protein product [Notodromas monacha]|uniref:3'-5' exonuclease domain-containing protein n=1 Tax=Notodromas monacha TaxID=399045 RepID=A0A7R9C0N5_9CRUS|nr:unnamed protein product [Notodromas monacha]CAG0924315.1 unnamed protein product [Notodromas monacha]